MIQEATFDREIREVNCHCTWDTKDEKELAKQGITCHAEEIAAEKVDKMDETNIRTGVEKI